MPPFNASSWKQLVKSYASDAEFASPTTEAQIAALEQSLAVQLPSELREFLLEADGFSADYGSRVIWSVSHIEQENREFRKSFRELYMPFDHLLLFGDHSGGDHYAFAICVDGQIRSPDIYCWDHETDGRAWFAGRLEQFLDTRLKKEDDDDVA
ncbi:MAG TPA: SMI1/KNR4 family protein [Methylomirabilota bacterium]|nr:SMI1/KNR4 family protein [Methylomirabilota bacterium]